MPTSKHRPERTADKQGRLLMRTRRAQNPTCTAADSGAPPDNMSRGSCASMHVALAGPHSRAQAHGTGPQQTSCRRPPPDSSAHAPPHAPRRLWHFTRRSMRRVGVHRQSQRRPELVARATLLTHFACVGACTAPDQSPSQFYTLAAPPPHRSLTCTRLSAR